MDSPRVIALIPARAGSKRVKSKNIRLLSGHPMISYTIAAALESGVFDRVIVSTEAPEVAEIALDYGAEVPFLRPEEFAQDSSPDIGWVKHAMETLGLSETQSMAYSILRPTSPLRTAQGIRAAWSLFRGRKDYDSLRAVEKCTEHPAKQWYIRDGALVPVLANPDPLGIPWHSCPYQSLPEVFAQNASLEISWAATLSRTGTIAGTRILPFVTEGYEGFDINREDDWLLLEALLARKIVQLPTPRARS